MKMNYFYLKRICIEERTNILIYFHGTVNGTREPEAGQKADTSAENTKDDADHSHVRKIDDHRQETDHFKTTSQEPNTVGK